MRCDITLFFKVFEIILLTFCIFILKLPIPYEWRFRLMMYLLELSPMTASRIDKKFTDSGLNYPNPDK
jgi:hypothetical protein|tara:strand:+ start:3683 stop:3886 length:204 start_codon:yes stop_codon:yes gene_type:complete